MAAQIIQLPKAQPDPVKNPPRIGGAWPRGVVSLRVESRKRWYAMASAKLAADKQDREIAGLWNSITTLENTAAACRAKVAMITQQQNQRRF